MNIDAQVRSAVYGLALLITMAPALGQTTGSGSAATSTPGPASGGMMQGGASADMHRSMMDSMKDMQSMQPTGDLDRDFAMMMRQHHLSGIEMARKELEHGKDPKMKAMARKIVESQQREIKEFDRWLSGRAGTQGKDGKAADSRK